MTQQEEISRLTDLLKKEVKNTNNSFDYLEARIDTVIAHICQIKDMQYED